MRRRCRNCPLRASRALRNRITVAVRVGEIAACEVRVGVARRYVGGIPRAERSRVGFGDCSEVPVFGDDAAGLEGGGAAERPWVVDGTCRVLR